MIDVQRAEEILRDTIKGKKRHRDYDYVVKYAERMKRLITGDGLEVELRMFASREDTVAFAERVKLTQLITPSICSGLLTPYFKLPRVNPVIKKIEIDDDVKKPVDKTKEVATSSAKPTVKQDSTEAKLKKITDAASNFYGDGKDVDYYLDKKWIPKIALDPNAFVVVTFDDFDSKFENAKPYPTEVSCEDAINFEYANNVLQWLIVLKKIKYDLPTYNPNEGAKQTFATHDGEMYRIYADNDIIDYTQVHADLHKGAIGTEYTAEDGALYFKIDSARVFKVNYYTPKGGMVQARRVGVFDDWITNGRTKVSPLQPAVPYLLKSIKEVSELDISISLHVFLQKLQYLPPCQGYQNETCNGGKLTNGQECPACKGTGFQISTSAQDALTLTLPRDPQSAFNLQQLVHYVNMPIDIVKFLDEHIDKIEKKCVKAMYNSELFSTDSVVNTATEKVTDMDSVNDSLYPTGESYSALWIFIHRMIATFVDVPNAKPQHAFPKDFKFKGLRELLSSLTAASESNAPMFARQEINNDIANIIFADKPDELTRLRVKQKFNPFDGKTNAEITTILSDDKLCPREHKILWSCSATIFTELENEHPKDNKMQSESGWFYDMKYEKQKALIDAKVEEIIQEIDEQNPQATVFGADGLPIGAEPQGDVGADGSDGAAGNGDNADAVDSKNKKPAFQGFADKKDGQFKTQ